MLNPEILRVIRQSYDQLYRANSVGHYGFVIIGLVIVACSFFTGPAGKPINGDPIFVFGIGFVIAMIGVGAIALARKNRVDLVDIINNRPTDIVWVYRQVNKATMVGVTYAQFEFVVFGLINKQQVKVRLPGNCVQALLQEIPEALSHVTLGYNAEHAQAFRQDPVSLLNPS
ncbi:MAG: hypothetical protein AAFQ95_22785 [Cyanobacteria bacterium J06621_3]